MKIFQHGSRFHVRCCWDLLIHNHVYIQQRCFVCYTFSAMDRLDIGEMQGLSTEEARRLTEQGLANRPKKFKSKGHLQIVLESFFTFFNIILYALAIVFLIVQLCVPEGLQYVPISKYAFLGIILLNAASSIISQEASKHVIEKMKLVTEESVIVIRDGIEVKMPPRDIVLGDIVKLIRGNGVAFDGTVMQGTLLANESNLTGESDPIKKEPGATVLSGSFVIAGEAYIKVEKVGDSTYISSIERRVGGIKKKKSRLIQDIYRLIKILLIFIVPAVLATLIKQWYIGKDGVHWVANFNMLTKSATVLVGMIPIGMLLLTSITLSKSIISLYKKHTMVQELYAIENLSRIDTLCLDKTGTLTTQNFILEDVIMNTRIDSFDELMSSFISAQADLNQTLLALKARYSGEAQFKAKEAIPFSSETKSSAVVFEDGRKVVLGAPEFIFSDCPELEEAKEYASKGYRTLGLTIDGKPAALFLLKDEKRKNIESTLKYFCELGVEIKIISGDNPLTVSAVAADCGVPHSENYISMENVPDEQIKEVALKYSIFGRVSPNQKQMLIAAMQESGRAVGYVGDGVNDTQSLRQADCSIAFASGADSTKAISDVVLLDDDFASLPQVVQEGRRVVKNIQRSILLFLSKSLFIGLFSLLSCFLKDGLPIEIEAIYVYEFVVIAVCGFLLSIENNKPETAKPNFIKRVLIKAFTYGLLLTCGVFVPLILDNFLDMPNSIYLIPVFISISGVVILFDIARPIRGYTLMVLLVGAFGSAFLLLMLPNVLLNPNYLKSATSVGEQIQRFKDAFFNLSIYGEMNRTEIWVLIGYFVLAPLIYFGIDKGVLALKNLILKKKEKSLSE